MVCEQEGRHPQDPMAKSKRSIAENEQLLQTVQMFEVIADTQPNDVQSLEILKEAYINLERDADAAKVSKKIAHAYVHLGQLSSAILEYEGILQKFPDDTESLAALGELESKMGGGSGGESKAAAEAAEKALKTGEQYEDPNEALVRFLQEHQLLSEKDAKSSLSAIQTALHETASDRPVPSLISILADRGISAPDKTLSLLAEKTRLPYIALSIYDVDGAKATMIEKEFCLRHLILPFDQISKTLFVATVNPFDAQAKNRMESETEGRIQWYLTDPLDLTKSIKDIFRIT